MNMTEDDGLRCSICGRTSGDLHICKQCNYLMKNGASEETLKRMYADDAVNKKKYSLMEIIEDV